MKRVFVLFGLLAALLLPLHGPHAHEVRPGFLELRATAANVFLMTWKVPALGTFRLGIEPRLPDSCHTVDQPTTMQAGGAFIEYGRVSCTRGLEGQRIAIDRLDGTLTDVLVRIENADGSVRTARLTPSDPSFIVPEQPGPLMVLRAYVGLGVEHILFGVDHLLFVLCLLLLVREPPAAPCYDHGVHAGTQHHAGGGNLGFHPCASRTGRSDDRTEHRISRQRVGARRSRAWRCHSILSLAGGL